MAEGLWACGEEGEEVGKVAGCLWRPAEPGAGAGAVVGAAGGMTGCEARWAAAPTLLLGLGAAEKRLAEGFWRTRKPGLALPRGTLCQGEEEEEPGALPERVRAEGLATVAWAGGRRTWGPARGDRPGEGSEEGGEGATM